jgi:hypothetical protein
MNPANGVSSADPLDFERLLRREMTIAPSGEFLARVRTRIDHEVVIPRWRWLVPVSAVAAGCAALAVVVVLRSGPVAPPNLPAAPSLSMAQPIRMLEAPPMQASTLPAANRRRLDPRAGVSRPEEPPVIVDELQRAALAALIHLMREGRLSGASFAQTMPVSLDPIRDRVKPVEARPLTVSAIFIDGVLQEEHR